MELCKHLGEWRAGQKEQPMRGLGHVQGTAEAVVAGRHVGGGEDEEGGKEVPGVYICPGDFGFGSEEGGKQGGGWSRART